MPSLSSLYTPSSGNAASMMADNALQGSDMATDAGLANSRLMSRYSNRLLPSLVSGHGARGTFYSGLLGRDADRLKEDVGEEAGDRQRLLNRQMAELRRRTVLGTVGLIV